MLVEYFTNNNIKERSYIKQSTKPRISGVLAAAICLSGTSLVAHADYVPCDVDHDGSISLSDTIME